MKLVSFVHQGQNHLGLLKDSLVVELTNLLECQLYEQGRARFDHASLSQILLPPDMVGFLRREREGWHSVEESLDYLESFQLPDREMLNGPLGKPLSYPLSEIDLRAPLPRPGKIICIGQNYRDHCEEQGVDPPEKPIIFSKFHNAVIGPGDAVKPPVESSEVDYEAELAFVMGERVSRDEPSSGLDSVAGYTIFNDVTARDFQFSDEQWIRGKSPDTFAPTGPALVTPDEVGNPHDLDIQLRLNGEIMQDSGTEELIFSVSELIDFISRSITLEPGDMVATGTPPGVGYFREPPVFLESGDRVEIEIENIGLLENPVE